MIPVVVRAGAAGSQSPRVAVLDVDGLLLNQNLTGLYSVGENPVASFREKLEAAAWTRAFARWSSGSTA